MRQMIERIFSYYAGECLAETADGVKTVRAFIEPIRSRAKEGFFRQMHELGEIPNDRYVYIGPVCAALTEDCTIRRDGTEFSVCRAETLYAQNEPIYIWALLKKVGGEDDAEND